MAEGFTERSGGAMKGIIWEHLQEMRAGVAAEYGFSLYRQYNEKAAAHYTGYSQSALKRGRERGEFPHVKYASGRIRYLGIHIADIIIGGEKAIEWHDTANENTASETGSSASGAIPPPGTAAGTTSELAPPSDTALARMTFSKPKAS